MTKKWKIDHIGRTKIDLGKDMDTNIQNMIVSQCNDGYMY